MQQRTAIILAASMAVSLAYAGFELGLRANDWQIVTGFVAAVVLAGALGYRFGRWYYPVEGEQPGFELLFCPVVVFILASCGGSALACLLIAVPEQSPAPMLLVGLPVLTLIGFSVVLASAWPVILISHAVAGLVLAWQARSAPNNSFKPRPLRGSA